MDDWRNYLQNENTNVSDKNIIDEVLRIKYILDTSGDKSESIICDSLIKLHSIVVSVKILEATGVGKSVSCLKYHTSSKVKDVARMMIKAWKGMVDEWVDAIEKKEEKGGDHVIKRNIIKVPMKLINKFKNNSKTESAAKGPVTPEQIVKSNEAVNTTRVCRQGVAEVLRLKKILEISTQDEEFVSVVCQALVKLEYMGLTLKTLEETGIGKTVRALEKHESKDVCEIATRLVKGWKSMVDECLKKESKRMNVSTVTKFQINSEKSNSQKSVVVTPDQQTKEMYSKAVVIQQKLEATKIKVQQLKINSRMEKGLAAKLQPKKRLKGRSIFVMEKKSLPMAKKNQSTVVKPNKVSVSMESKLQSPPKSIGQPKSQVPFQQVEPKTIDKRSVEEKVVATKRKLHEDYEKAKNMKKRRVQMIEVYDVLGQGLAPKYENDRSCLRINRCIGLVHR